MREKSQIAYQEVVRHETKSKRPNENDLRILEIIKRITARGNNAEVRQKADGSLTVYEVKKNIVSVG